MEGRSFELRQIIGDNIRERRRRNGLTQEQFSSKVLLSVTSLSSLENGEHFAKMDTYCRIADVFGIPICALFRPHGDLGDNAVLDLCVEMMRDFSTSEQVTILSIMEKIRSLIHRY